MQLPSWCLLWPCCAERQGGVVAPRGEETQEDIALGRYLDAAGRNMNLGIKNGCGPQVWVSEPQVWISEPQVKRNKKTKC